MRKYLPPVIEDRGKGYPSLQEWLIDSEGSDRVLLPFASSLRTEYPQGETVNLPHLYVRVVTLGGTRLMDKHGGWNILAQYVHIYSSPQQLRTVCVECLQDFKRDSSWVGQDKHLRRDMTKFYSNNLDRIVGLQMEEVSKLAKLFRIVISCGGFVEDDNFWEFVSRSWSGGENHPSSVRDTFKKFLLDFEHEWRVMNEVEVIDVENENGKDETIEVFSSENYINNEETIESESEEEFEEVQHEIHVGRRVPAGDIECNDGAVVDPSKYQWIGPACEKTYKGYVSYSAIHLSNLKKSSRIIRLGECVCVRAAEGGIDYIGRVNTLFDKGSMGPYMQIEWFCSWGDEWMRGVSKEYAPSLPTELFMTRNYEDHSLLTVFAKCVVRPSNLVWNWEGMKSITADPVLGVTQYFTWRRYDAKWRIVTETYPPPPPIVKSKKKKWACFSLELVDSADYSRLKNGDGKSRKGDSSEKLAVRQRQPLASSWERSMDADAKRIRTPFFHVPNVRPVYEDELMSSSSEFVDYDADKEWNCIKESVLRYVVESGMKDYGDISAHDRGEIIAAECKLSEMSLDRTQATEEGMKKSRKGRKSKEELLVSQMEREAGFFSTKWKRYVCIQFLLLMRSWRLISEKTLLKCVTCLNTSHSSEEEEVQTSSYIHS